MAGLNIRILMQLTACPGREDELKNLLLLFIQNRCQQGGCLSCEMLQHRIDETRFIVVEEWDANARLQSDLETETFQGIFETGAALMLEPPLIDWYDVSRPCIE